jgi:hypothetical protein
VELSILVVDIGITHLEVMELLLLLNHLPQIFLLLLVAEELPLLALAVVEQVVWLLTHLNL